MGHLKAVQCKRKVLTAPVIFINIWLEFNTRCGDLSATDYLGRAFPNQRCARYRTI